MDLVYACALQRTAFAADPVVPWAVRADRLRRLQTLLRSQADAFAAALQADYGARSPVETRQYEVFPCLKALRHALRHGRGWMAVRRPWADWWALPARCQIRPQPLGVVGVIAPWNYPLLLSLGPVVDALVAGNR